MTELEQKLASALEALGQQYSADMKILAEQVASLSKRLDEQSKANAQRIESLSNQLNEHAKRTKELTDAYNTLATVWNEESA